MLDRTRPFFSGIRGAAAAILAHCWLGAASVHAGGVVTPIHSFSALAPNGSSPYTPLVQGTNGNFYGTADDGGTYGFGTVYEVTPAGVLTTLYSFTLGNDGGNPRGGLVQGTNGSFYGTTQDGGTNGDGAIFMITPQGVLTSLHSFASEADGANPLAGLIQGTDGNFYGTTFEGGSHDGGTVFQISPSGAFTNIYSFKGEADGADPLAPLVQGTDGELYGTTYSGGNTSLNDGYGYGAIFKITTGGAITPLYGFTDGSDGESPYSGLVQGIDGSFYGTAIHGTTGYGAIFQITPSGGFNVLYDFGGDDGAGPMGTLIQASDTNLYGTTLGGGSNDAGTIFEITTNGAFMSLYSFDNTSSAIAPSSGPFAGLIQGTNGNLYGVTLGGGDGSGTMFTATTNGDVTTLCSFPGGGGDGAYPRAALLADGNGLLYGTADEGGTNGDGAVFQISTNGVLWPVYSFTNWTDGANPQTALVRDSSGNLWGTTGNYSPLAKTGAAAYGTVFKMTTNGVLTTVYAFKDGSDGGSPHAGVIEGADGNFYGTSEMGGSGYGTIFRITPAGVFTNLHSFNGGSDGGYPYAALLQANDTNFYGTTTGGGSGYGTIFKITPKGAFSVVRALAGGNSSSPYGALIQGADGNLYGTTSGESASGYGTIFRITLPGTFTNLYSFTNGMDGASPMAGLVQGSDGNFYGTTSAGGLNGNGTVFRLTAAGSFQALYSFSAINEAEYNQTGLGLNQDGVGPCSALVQAGDGSFYGVAEFGGRYGSGTVFRLTLSAPPPPAFLLLTETGGAFNFTWTAQAGSLYQLQYCANLAQTNWINLGAAMPAAGSTLAGLDAAPADAHRFYRVVGLP
jgi:uncharacterized repeat protein (TIGR03803 family)